MDYNEDFTGQNLWCIPIDYNMIIKFMFSVYGVEWSGVYDCEEASDHE